MHKCAKNDFCNVTNSNITRGSSVKDEETGRDLGTHRVQDPFHIVTHANVDGGFAIGNTTGIHAG